MIEQLLMQTIDKNGFVDLPILSHIEGNLYTGISPCYWPTRGHDCFSTIFDFFVFDETYEVKPPTVRFQHKIYDGPELPTKEQLFRVADQINEARRAGLTLVHCQMGINRSNLFAAAALYRAGSSIDDAIQLLREKRSPYVLLNQHFERFLRKELA